MSAPTEERDEVADSGKDDDKSFVTPAVSDSDVKGDSLIGTVDVNLNSDAPTEIESASTENTENCTKPLPPDEESTTKADLNTCDETNVAAAESESMESSSVPIETHNLLSAVKDPSDIPSTIKDIEGDAKNSEVSGKVTSCAYKETVIDDVSESDIELRWSDDEDDAEIAAAPLSDDALKKLDAELGIVDADSNEKIEDETLKMLDMELGIDNTEDTSMVSVVLPTQTVPEADNTEDDINIEPNVLEQNITDAENLEKSDDVNTDPGVLVQNITDSENQQAMANILKPVEIKNEIIDYIEVKIETNPEISTFTQDNVHVESALKNLKVEFKGENSMDINFEMIETVPCMSNVDVISEQIDTEKCINNDKLANINQEMDVDVIDKISEIDIDETIVDIKRLIDQDEDTINQLGLSKTAEKVKDENEKFKTIDDDKTKLMKIVFEAEESEHEVIKTSLTTPAINEDEPMDLDMETKDPDKSLNLENISKDHISKDVGSHNDITEATSDISEIPTDELKDRKKDPESIDENKSNNLVEVDKDVQITDKDVQVTDKNVQVTDKDVQVTDKDVEETDKDVEVTDKDGEVTDKEVQVTDKDVQVTDKDVEVTDKDVEVTDKDVEVTDKDGEVTDKDGEVTDKDVEETDKYVEVTDKYVEVTDKDGEVTDKDVQVTDKDVQVTDKDVEVTDKDVQVTDKDVQVTDKGGEVTDKDVQVTNKNVLLKCVEIDEEKSMVGIETIDDSNDPKPSGDLNFVEIDECSNKDTRNMSTDATNAIKAMHTPDKTDFKESSMTSDLIERDDTNTEEMITPDITNTSIKINTEHRITRPDVMLDIPTQEFVFDEFDDTTEQHESEEAATKDSDLTTQTVSEIVKRLAKENMEIDKIHNIKESKLESKIKDINVREKHIEVENQSKEFCRDSSDVDMASIENIDTTDVEGDTEKVDIDTLATLQKIDKTIETYIESPENVQAVEESKENKEKANNSEIKPSRDTTKDADKIQITLADDEVSEAESKSKEKVEKTEAKTLSDPQPSTSECITEETREAEDDLDLLAESSRVMEEDDDDEPEAEDDEADDGEVDDDEDFDPEDDNSNPTAEHSEESNPPSTEVDIQEDGIDIDFDNEADKIGLDSNDATFETLMDDTRDATLEETEQPATLTKAAEDPIETEEETDSKDVDESNEAVSDCSAQPSKPKERRNSILAGLLTRPAADMHNTKSSDVAQAMEKMLTDDVSEAGVVDLGESSSDDDTQEDKEKSPVEIKFELDAPGTGISADTETTITKAAITNEEKDMENDDSESPKMAEIFSLDSDDDDKKDVSYIETPREHNHCINFSCTSDDKVDYYLADRITIAYYGGARRSKRAVCKKCLDVVNARNEGLVSGIKDLRPLMALRMARPAQTLLEISDSDSEGDEEPLGEKDAGLLEGKLTDMLNKVWIKYNMEERLQATEDYLEAELEIMQKQSQEVDKLLRDCQKATDSLRTEFYSSFEGPRHELPSISIHDTPIASYACLETEDEVYDSSHKDIFPVRYPKRRSTTALDTPAKKQAGLFDDRKVTRYTAHVMADEQGRFDEDKDISVVRLSAEAAPADLPPLGELVKAPLKLGSIVYAMKNQYGAWIKGRVLEMQPKQNDSQFTMCRVRFDQKGKSSCKQLSARSMAYTEPSDVRMTIGTRVIALFKNSENSIKKGEFYYSGVVAEIPNPVNAYRYLVFFDDGYAQYVEHRHTRVVYESKTLVWEEVHPFSRDFVCNYLMKYPERPMVRMHPGQEVNVEWNGKWWDTKVVSVDAALVHVQFPDNRTEWIYRGSTRLKPLFNELLAAKRADKTRMQRSTKTNTKANAPYVEYTRSEDQVKTDTQSADDMRRQRSVAKKSTSIAQQISSAATDGVTSRVVFYTPKNSVRPLKMVPHTCGAQCKRSDLLSLKDLRTYNPLTKPLLSGWERQIVRHKASRAVMYCAPCGRRLRTMPELHRYLRAVRSDMPVDLFDFNPNTHCLAEFVLNKTNVQKKDLSHGKENVPVPCVNYYDHSLPEFCSYNTVRTPTAGVPLNLDPGFLCGCDCDDDCVDKSKCACWKMTLEGARTIGMDSPDIGYDYRRLPEPLPSGIYECNSRCKCKSTCLNRVVQNPLQLKLQVFKTLNRGWGIRALNDVPKGSFICIYAGNLLTDATANLDGINEGDEYLAELDYIEVVEAMKEGYEDDIPEADKELNKKDSKADGAPESDSTESEEEEREDKSDTQDGDFEPGYLGHRALNSEFSKRLRRRDKKKNKDSPGKAASEEKMSKKDIAAEYITISDDEEVREPSRFAAQESMKDDKIISKYRSIRQYYGKDEACYIMDAKVQGNIGRYLNHSCSPNVFVQNVFVDTHDPRFPWVSFFALHHIRAGTELTWNYNYDIGSVPGKVLYCYCAAPNCRGRLL